MKKKVLKSIFALVLAITMAFDTSTITVEAKANLPEKQGVDTVTLESELKGWNPLSQLLVDAHCIR